MYVLQKRFEIEHDSYFLRRSDVMCNYMTLYNHERSTKTHTLYPQIHTYTC